MPKAYAIALKEASSFVYCPRCHCPTMLVDSAFVYGRSYGPIYLCLICGAYVGCHPGSTRPPPWGRRRIGPPARRGTWRTRHLTRCGNPGV